MRFLILLIFWILIFTLLLLTIKNIEYIFFDSYKINVELNPDERNAIINYTDNICVTSDNNRNKSCIKDEVNISQTNQNIFVEQNYTNSDSNYSLNNIDYSSDLVNASNYSSVKNDSSEILEIIDQNNSTDFILTGQSDPFLKISSFAYQLQNIDLEKIKNSNYDLVVIDYAPENKYVGFSKDQISYAKNGNKLIFSYLSIGEAENYRWYWKDEWDANNDGFPDKNAPEWLLESNPNWSGNYVVKYWNENWQNIIFQYLDKIISAEFDGAVLDTVDVYYYFNNENSKNEMKKFVEMISEYAKAKNKNFKIIVNGGIEFVEDRNYVNSIDGVLKESVYYNDGKTQEIDEIEWTLSFLRKLKEEGKKIFIIEYIEERDKVEYVSGLVRNEGFLIFFTNKDLSVLLR